jgi:hypothetical protein
MNIMIRRFLTVAAISSAVVFVSGAQAVTISASTGYLLGEITNVTPSAPSDQFGYVNTLIGRYNGGLGDGTVAGRAYDVNAGANVPAAPGAPLALLAGNSGNFGGGAFTSTTVDVTGFTWLYLKASDDAAVYYVGGLTGVHTFTNDAITNQNGNAREISHLFLLTAPGGGNTPGVPDGGSTVLLLGAGLALLAVARRKLA